MVLLLRASLCIKNLIQWGKFFRTTPKSLVVLCSLSLSFSLSPTPERCFMRAKRATVSRMRARWGNSVGKWENVKFTFDANTKTQINFERVFLLAAENVSRREIYLKRNLSVWREKVSSRSSSKVYFFLRSLTVCSLRFLGIHNTMMKFHIFKTKTLAQHLWRFNCVLISFVHFWADFSIRILFLHTHWTFMYTFWSN